MCLEICHIQNDEIWPLIFCIGIINNCNLAKDIVEVLQNFQDSTVSVDTNGMAKYMADDIEEYTIGKEPMYGKKGKNIQLAIDTSLGKHVFNEANLH